MKGHVSIALEVGNRDLRRVDGQLLVVHAETVPVGVGVREETGLQHRVGGRLDTGHQMRGRERGLLDLREVVLGVGVEDELADGSERKLRVRPDLGKVEYAVAEFLGLLRRHRLDVDGPAREFAPSRCPQTWIGLP